MEMLESMLDFLQMCPSLADMDSQLDSAEAGNGWTLYDCGEDLLSLYWDGTRRKKREYSIELRVYSSTDSERIENARRLESIAEWVNEQNDLELLPELTEGKTALSLECELGEMGHLSEDGISGTYHLQLNLVYVERGAELAS